ncbi:Transmembrane Emp24 Domain-Containing Protein 5 [Manis pentadactyla]|nr:Transmembrane Emp24 Domain-Containing Protein 5 [Manis pentadactyla]
MCFFLRLCFQLKTIAAATWRFSANLGSKTPVLKQRESAVLHMVETEVGDCIFCTISERNKTVIWFLRMLFLCNAVRRRRKNREAEDTEERSINEMTGGHGIQEEKLDLEKGHPSPRRMRFTF